MAKGKEHSLRPPAGDRKKGAYPAKLKGEKARKEGKSGWNKNFAAAHKQHEGHGAKRVGDRRMPSQGPPRSSTAAPGATAMRPHHMSPRARAAAFATPISSKLSHNLSTDLHSFKARLQQLSFGPLDQYFALVPDQVVFQHLPSELAPFRSYLPKFAKGSANSVIALSKWMEWAFHEHKKTERSAKKKEKEEDEAENSEDDEKEEKSATRASMGTVAEQRTHIRTLLQMSVRYTADKRKIGQRAFVNHVANALSEHDLYSTLDDVKAVAHHTVAYALSRLVLGMATETFGFVAYHCNLIAQLMSQCTSLSPSVLLAVANEELNMAVRMKALMKRQLQALAEGEGEEEAAEEDGIDPDDLADPTKGERNQRLAACVMAMAALLAARSDLAVETIEQMIQYLSYCYIEQKGLRVLTGALILDLVKRAPQTVHREECWNWLNLAFFKIHKLEYFRPEAVRFIFYLASNGIKPKRASTQILRLCEQDPLSPTAMEQIANALFRKDLVTACHPMVHPVWKDIFDVIVARCKGGESPKVHLSNVIHLMIAPYRRGNAEAPRMALFRKLGDEVGRIAWLVADAQQRAELVAIATKTIGYGTATTVAKPSAPATLRALSLDEMEDKVMSLLSQYDAIRDQDPSASTSRLWVLRELKACLAVDYQQGTEVEYVNLVVESMLRHGLLKASSRDERLQNKCLHLFADIISFTLDKPGKSRLKSNIPVTQLISTYLEAEEKGETRFRTALDHSKFRKARNKIVAALDDPSNRSVLFFEPRDMHLLLMFLFFVLSTDDPENEAAADLAKSVVPDIVKFYQVGTIETLPLLFDAMMPLITRTECPVHIFPLMIYARRLATSFIVRFGRFIKSKETIDLVLSPLSEAFGTNEREELRQKEANAAQEDEDAENAASGAQKAEEESEEEEEEEEEEGGEEEEQEEEEEEEDELTEADSDEGTVDDDEELSAAEEEEELAEDNKGDAVAKDDDESSFVEEEPPTEEYLASLRTLSRGKSYAFEYPTDTAQEEKSATLRAIHTACKTGLQMKSGHIVHVFQVLLGVMRANIKSEDDVVFSAARSSVEMLLMTKNRFFGSFVGATDLLQLLGDVQSYCRKAEIPVTHGKGLDKAAKAKLKATVKRRLMALKKASMSVLHFVGYLAWKNGASEEACVVLGEYAASIYFGRGWVAKKGMMFVKADMHNFRHGFAWCFLPALVDHFEVMRGVEGMRRAQLFAGCCSMVEAVLPRLSGLPAQLKFKAGSAIERFFKGMSLAAIFEMKQTALYEYLHAIRMVLKYNKRVNLDTNWAAAVVAEVVENDDLKITKATARVVNGIEKMLGIPAKVLNTKICTSYQALHQQHPTPWRKKKATFYDKVKEEERKALGAVLAARNQEPTFNERAAKRMRREDKKTADLSERRRLREEKRMSLSKEEREERRKKMAVAKQQRVAKNRDRKRMLHESRSKAFEKWRENKLAELDAEE